MNTLSVSTFIVCANRAGWTLTRTAATLNALGCHYDGQRFDSLSVLIVLKREHEKQSTTFPENCTAQARAVRRP